MQMIKTVAKDGETVAQHDRDISAVARDLDPSVVSPIVSATPPSPTGPISLSPPSLHASDSLSPLHLHVPLAFPHPHTRTSSASIAPAAATVVPSSIVPDDSPVDSR